MAYTKKSAAATARYKKAHIKRIPLEVQLPEYAAIKEHVAGTGESVNGFCKRAIRNQMRMDGKMGDKNGAD